MTVDAQAARDIATIRAALVEVGWDGTEHCPACYGTLPDHSDCPIADALPALAALAARLEAAEAGRIEALDALRATRETLAEWQAFGNAPAGGYGGDLLVRTASALAFADAALAAAAPSPADQEEA